MQKVLGAALIVAFGIGILLLTREWFAWLIVVSGLFNLATAWRYRDALPIDPVFLADVRASTKLRKSDPASADKLVERALVDADEREKKHLADLRRRAGTDRRAAIELRNWLRDKLRIDPSALQEAEKMIADSVDRARVREELNRVAREREQELAEVQELLADYPFYILWRDQAMGYLRDFRSLPTGGPSAYIATIAPGLGILAIFALLPLRSDVQLRTSVTGIALIIAVLGLVRPRAFWELAVVEDLREILGDRMVVLVCIAMCLLIIGAAWWIHL